MPVDIHREIYTINYSLKNRRTSLIHFYGLDLAIFFTEVPDMLLLLFASRSKYYFEVNLCLGYLVRNLTYAWTSVAKIELLNMTLSVFTEPGVSPVTRLVRLFWLQSQFFPETLVPWTCLDGLTEEEIKFEERYFTQTFCDCLYHILFSTTWYLDDYEGHDEFETRATVKEKPFQDFVKHPLISQGLLDQIRWLKSNLCYPQERFVHPHGVGTVSRVLSQEGGDCGTTSQPTHEQVSLGKPIKKTNRLSFFLLR